MKLFLSLFAVNVKRAIFSLPSLLSVCGVALVVLLTSLGQTADADVLYLLGMGSGSENILLIVGILPVFPFATTFASEWQQHTTGFWIVRTGIRNYSVNKVLVSALSGFLTTALGMLLFVLAMCTMFPFFTHFSTGNAFNILLQAGMPVFYLCYYIIGISLGSVLFAVAGLWISTYIPNKFVAVASPLVLYFVAHRFTNTLDIPPYLKVVRIVEGTYDAGTPSASLLVKLGTVLVLCLLMGFATVRQIQRRVQHD